MKKRMRFEHQSIVLLCLLLTCNLSLPAQSDTSWIRHYPMDTFYFSFPAGLEACGDDAVIILAAAAEDDNPPDNRSALLRIDGDNGDIIWKTQLIHNPVAEASHLFFLIRGLVRLRDGSYVVMVTTLTEHADDGFALHRIAADGTLIWRRDYGIPGQNIIANSSGLTIGPDSMSVAVTARRYDVANPSSNIIIYHIDAAGNITNDLSPSTGLSFYAEKSPLVMLTDSSFIIGFNLGNFDLSGVKLLRRVSYTGDVLESHTTWDFGWWSDLKLHPSGNVIAISKAYSSSGDEREEHGLRTTMYTIQLDTIWSRVYNEFFGPFLYHEVDFPGAASFDSKGNILTYGDGSALNSVRPIHLVKYNVHGEQLWLKRIGFGEDVGGYLNSIGGKIAFNKHGILLVGANSVNGILLVRLDSAACVTELPCDTTILVNIEDEPKHTIPDFQVIPNPTMDYITATFPEDLLHSLAKPTIHVVDIMGKVLKAFPLIKNNQSLDLTAATPGM